MNNRDANAMLIGKNPLTDAIPLCEQTSEREPSQIRDRATVAAHWYVGEADTRRIKQVARTLNGGPVQTFLPTELHRVRECRNGVQSTKYTLEPRPVMFQFFFLSGPLDMLPRRDTRIGFLGLLRRPGGAPAACLPGEVERLMAEAEEEHRRALQAFARDTAPPRRQPRLKAGAMVQVVRGIMKGKVGEVERCDGRNTVVWLTGPTGARWPVQLFRADLTDE